MSTQKVAAWSHAEEFVAAGAHVEEAVRHGEELGHVPVGNGVGAALQLLAAATGAKAVDGDRHGCGCLGSLAARRHAGGRHPRHDRSSRPSTSGPRVTPSPLPASPTSAPASSPGALWRCCRG